MMGQGRAEIIIAIYAEEAPTKTDTIHAIATEEKERPLSPHSSGGL